MEDETEEVEEEEEIDVEEDSSESRGFIDAILDWLFGRSEVEEDDDDLIEDDAEVE